MHKTHALAQRDSVTPETFHPFLWWLSTAEKELIKDCKVDNNRYAITGMAVLGTWLFATLAWSYFFYTVVKEVVSAAMLGIFMGLIILSIDRALIKGITSANKRKAGPLIFRFILALTIGTFMAQPALLYLFDKEIHSQISIDNEKRILLKKNQMDSVYQDQQSALQQEKTTLNNTLDKKYEEVAALRQSFLAETDGSGGSGKRGYETIAKTKEAEYLKTERTFEEFKKRQQDRLAKVDSSLQTIEKIKAVELASFKSTLNDGFLTRIEALHHLIEGNGAARFRYYLLVVILVLIELMPVIAKTLLPAGSYEERVRQQEWLEKDMITYNLQKERELKEMYNRLSYEQDKEFIETFFAEARQERLDKMRERLKKWKTNNHEAFDDIWSMLKKDVLSKQEN